MGRTIALGALALFALAGCQSGGGKGSGVIDTPDAGKPSSSAAAVSSTTSTPAGAAKLGSSITLAGLEDGEKLTVTLVKVVNPAAQVDEFSAPAAGNKFVAVEFRLSNAGTATYDDAPSNGAKLVDVAGHQFESSVDDTKAGVSLPTTTKLKPGAAAIGYITFEVPATTRLASVQFALNSGFADQTGEWTLR